MTEQGLERELRIDPSIGAVEVKITAQAADEERVREALESAHIEPESREIYFFDTVELDLFESGLVLRARLVHDGADDSTVKLRPVDASSLDEVWKATEGFEIELDAVGADAICSAKLSVDQRRGEIEEVVAGRRSVMKLFSRAQERLIAQHRGAELDWEALQVFGPVQVRKWEATPKELGYEITVEEWVLPDRSDLVELSVKAPPSEAGSASDAFLAYLQGRGMDIEGEQQTKTRSALRYFTTGEGLD
jgi:hypothetical protein